VVLSRETKTRVMRNGKKARALSMVRTRQCVECSFKWKTIERYYRQPRYGLKVHPKKRVNVVRAAKIVAGVPYKKHVQPAEDWMKE